MLVALPTKDRSSQHLIVAAHEGDIPTVKTLIGDGADINYQDSDALTPLIAAVLENKISVVQELLDRTVDVNMVGFEQCTALCFAAEKTDPTIFNMLIKAGADVNGGLGMRPLHRAANVNNAHIIERLLELGADSTIQAFCKSDQLETPLELAIRLGEVDAIIALTTHITEQDLAPFYTTILALQQSVLGKSQGRDLAKKHIVPEMIKELVRQKVAHARKYVPQVDEQELNKLIQAKVYQALNKYAQTKNQKLPEEYTTQDVFDNALGSF